MSGPVTYSNLPFASSVIVGDQSGGPAINGAGITLATITARMYGGDSIDDGTPAGRARAEAYNQAQVKAGVFKQADLDKGTGAVAKETDPKGCADKPQAPGNSIPGNFDMNVMLSDRTSLNQFINTLVAIPGCKRNAVPAQCGLQPADIVKNLSTLCKNVWDPLKAQYPNAVITNSLRVGDNIGAGPHGTGQAMDIQFNGTSGTSIPPSEYFAIAQWARDNLAYNQLLLEYSTAKGYLVAWLHMSVQADNGKNANAASCVMTFMNNASRGVGLMNLAT
jgi:hypothetical protein